MGRAGIWGKAKTPRSLRSFAAVNAVDEKIDNYSGRKVSAVAGLIAVASFSGAEAPIELPPVTVEAPVARPVRLRRNPPRIKSARAMRCGAPRERDAAQRRPRRCRFPTPARCARTAIPMRTPAAPYKVDHVQASGKFPEPLLNTPKTVTVLSKEVLEDKNATTLKQAVLSTAGVTLGTGEGGNAFGDRFFIRGFDARNDVFIDGVRDSGVSVRENFFTEQVEILRGPGSSFAGRGTTGGAINIVTKQATTEKSFYNMDTAFGTDETKRVTLDVNQVISPTLGDPGRRHVPGRRRGRPRLYHRRSRRRLRRGEVEAVDAVKITADYIHTDLHGITGFRRAVLPAGLEVQRSLVTQRPAARSRISAPTATISTASSIAISSRCSRTSGRSTPRSRSPRISSSATR